jgi:NADH:ubiquinone oxidoreductase subunit K
MILSCSLNFLVAAKLFNDSKGQLFALIVLTISTAETVLGLSLLLKTFKIKNTLNVFDFKRFK